MKVLMMPDFTGANPYQADLAEALQAQGSRVRFADHRVVLAPILRAALACRADVLHLHWTHPFTMHRRLSVTLIRSAQTLAELALLRLSGVRIVWTIHNLSEHEQRHPRLERWVLWALARLAHERIVHSEAALRAVMKAYGLPARVIPHGVAEPVRWEQGPAREILSLPTSLLYLVFGLVRAYKRVPDIIKAFRCIADPRAVLLIVGQPRTQAIQDEVDGLAAMDPRVIVRWGFVPEPDVAKYFASADSVVVAHEGITSGVAVLAAAYGKRLVDGGFRSQSVPATLLWGEVATRTLALYQGEREAVHAHA